jgi:hypothetical protein
MKLQILEIYTANEEKKVSNKIQKEKTGKDVTNQSVYVTFF